MPEAAMDEDDGLEFREDDVGGAGEATRVQAETEAEAVEGPAQEQLGTGVLGMNAGHDAGAGGARYGVHQSPVSCLVVMSASRCMSSCLGTAPPRTRIPSSMFRSMAASL